MRLYPKKLRNIQELERERSRLKKQIRAMDEEDFLLPGFLFGEKNQGGKRKGKKEAGPLQEIVPLLKPLLDRLAEVIKRRFIYSKSKEERDKSGNAGSQSEPLLKEVAKEFIGGYLKWKAIEATCKGLRNIVRKRRAQRP